jgi:hypothetical protein
MAPRLKTVEVTETYKMPDLASKVEKGVALLDKKAPGWEKKVDLGELDLSSGTYCVVGQLAIKAILNGPLDGYSDGIEKLLGRSNRGLRRTAEEAHGFIITEKTAGEVVAWLETQPVTHPWWPVLFGPNQGQASTQGRAVMQDILYDYLTAIWVQVIKARKSQARKLAEARRAAKKAVTPAKKTTAKKTVAKKAAKRVAR